MPRTKKITTKEIETQTIKEEEEDNEEVILAQQCNPMKFECPVCKKFLEMQNEMVIKKKGGCSCKYSPFSFKLSKTDKNLTIDKKEKRGHKSTLRIRYWKNSIPVLKTNQVQYYSSGSEAWNSIPWSILILVWYWFGIDPDIGLIMIAISIWYWSGYGLAWSNFDLEFTAQKSFAAILQRVRSAKLVLQSLQRKTWFTASSQRKTSLTGSSQRVYSAKPGLQRVHSESTAQKVVYSEFTEQKRGYWSGNRSWDWSDIDLKYWSDIDRILKKGSILRIEKNSFYDWEKPSSILSIRIDQDWFFSISDPQGIETDIHDITFKWGRNVSPAQDTSTQETVKTIMDKST